MELPVVAVPDCSDLLYVFHVGQVCVWAGIVFAEDEITPPVFQVLAFGEADLLVFRVEFEAVFFECDR